MTNNENPLSRLTIDQQRLTMMADGEALAKAMIDAEDFDLFDLDLIERLERMMPALAFISFCQAAEICPTHHADIAICADDDEPDCRPYREGLTNG